MSKITQEDHDKALKMLRQGMTVRRYCRRDRTYKAVHCGNSQTVRYHTGAETDDRRLRRDYYADGWRGQDKTGDCRCYRVQYQNGV